MKNFIDYLKISDYKIINLSKDEVFINENDECKAIYLIIEGSIKISTYLEDGQEVIFNYINRNEFFGTNLIFSSHPYFKGSIISTDKTKLIEITKHELLKLLKSEDTLNSFLKIQADFTIKLNERIKLLAMPKAYDRLMFFLTENHNQINYSSITSLAKELSLQRETLSRLLSNLEKQNKIILNEKIKIIKLK